MIILTLRFTTLLKVSTVLLIFQKDVGIDVTKVFDSKHAHHVHV